MPNIPSENVSDLDALCKDFNFTKLGRNLADFLVDREPTHTEIDISELQAAIAEQKLQHQRDVGCLEKEIAEMRRPSEPLPNFVNRYSTFE